MDEVDMDEINTSKVDTGRVDTDKVDTGKVDTGKVDTDKVNLRDKLALFTEHWSPKVIGEVNDFHVKLAKVKGEFVWHHHEKEDELFLVLSGTLRMLFRDREVSLGEGEMIVVPRGVEHCPVAEEEVHVLLFEPASTLNTGGTVDERTVAEPERI